MTEHPPTAPDPDPDPGEHYFTADPSVPFTREPVEVEVWGRRLPLVTGTGVFARGRLDVGTAALFRTTDPPSGVRRVLDLGCGYGVIGLAVALAVPDAQVVGVDVNARALLLADENARALGVAGRYRAVLPDAVPDGAFDEIWSNPPIRIGKAALHDLLLRWLPRLAPGGRAVLVVGKNLGADSLARWLDEQGWPTTRLASAKGFRVLEVRRAP
ncbi:methyltransferase [Nocardioides sp. ChNu-153]|uniref:class I SAM-dependent methyltransferase n=1 Tax=unclassified Nocardioides TaxID=2615069 RepID=UPI002404FFD3|nr:MULTISPECIES: methyltransferase [unclassified Nocardioides]MDF9717841.1 methyltransferase [Nocardioides sp. ChNu-99]MDN7121421.1 methyltransferase [Nocardioides sp. ChNu-153]